MAIKQIDEIPSNPRATSQKGCILVDIQTALVKGIDKFEFVGEQYNYKYLAKYARQVADFETDRRLRMEWIEKNPDKAKFFSMPHHYDRHLSSIMWIEISSIKDEKQGRRVFCEIHPNGIEDMIEAHEKYLQERGKK